MLRHFDTLIELFEAFPTEQHAIDHLTAIRWRNGRFCPLCGNADGARIGTLTGSNTHKCYVCRERFSIRVGTIFQDTKLPLRKWFVAIWLINAHPKGIASTTLAKDLGVTQKTAWFVLHRLRHAQKTPSFQAPLRGVVEIDETFVGGRQHNMHADKRKEMKGGASGKAVVFGIIQRDGDLRAGVVDDVKQTTLEPIVYHHVANGSVIYTDEHRSYRDLKYDFRHSTVRHSDHQYVNGSVHTNSIESVWALLKRQIIGIHHWVSPKHLDAYVSEMAFRFNRRDEKPAQRMNDMLAQIEGPLPYKVLTA